MKKNRQIGLDGKVFISSSLKRGTIFVFALLMYGVLNAFADILKLTGSSGAVMSTFTTTLLIYDFIVSLLLVVVVFYAYFLECGSSVPLLRHKPLVVFGFFRLGYYIMLAYYVCYRSLYCLTHTQVVRLPMFFFYTNYFALIFCCIFANCYIYNILTRNIIRRSYRKSFHTLATVGIITQALLPVTYVIARATMVDVGDEFFTSALCDMIRLCVCPILLSGIWFLFLHSIKQIDEVFDEVDDALRNKRYQITYSAITDGKSGKKKESAAPVAAAAFLPAPSKTVNPIASGISQPAITQGAAPSQVEPRRANAGSQTTARPRGKVMSPAERVFATLPPEQQAAAAASITDAATQSEQPKAQYAAPQPPAQSMPVQNTPVSAPPQASAPVPVRVVPTAPVQEYDPFPSGNVPLRSGKPQQGKRTAQGGGQQRPQNGQQNRRGGGQNRQPGQNGRQGQNRSGHR